MAAAKPAPKFLKVLIKRKFLKIFWGMEVGEGVVGKTAYSGGLEQLPPRVVRLDSVTLQNTVLLL